ncbi:TIM barrel protein [Brachybacterium sp. J144]|uniref:sugar phosphate isomerase/epimerase family protein n=1 Tax=Brachybacterium sp. J144 TaxID=3116487 RepID=UPI002E798DA7|nr:TIM barrel protein [Brachybacterium sp. J144]MEE1650649.1 TIM barrel protein [Brachybacterium sp. J144]
MIRAGLCSVTFRPLSPEQIVDLTVGAGLSRIEWAGDVHVPPGDPGRAEEVRALTENALLDVASYGSYLRFEGDEEQVRADGEAVLASAVALGAPRIRVWAGSQGSADVAPEERARIAARVRAFADRAGEAGVEVGLEFHGRTLTDEIGSTLALLDEVSRENVLSYWQPHQDMPDADALATLRATLPHASTIHVFSWWPGSKRLPLAERGELWEQVFGILVAEGSPRDALLEFVPGDDPATLEGEAETLRALIAAGKHRAASAAPEEPAR